jgi:tRNA-splicing ligase RtcB (3'-phosphate/5'-hydroxy nucleic acid ligase)
MELKQKGSYIWEIPQSGDMQVPARIYASDELIQMIKNDLTLRQVRNVACLPGIQTAAYAMPDAHQGYGFPIGGVAAFDLEDGIISPGGVGYDINCGVRLIRTGFSAEEIQAKKRDLIEGIYQEIPAGLGKGGATRLQPKQLQEVCRLGMEWAVQNGYGTEEDLERTEEYGCLKQADPKVISSRAMERGIPQLGTLGSGNHFLEIQKVAKIYDEKTARAFGIESEDQVMVMIHCGSRGLGHQIASDFIHAMENTFGTGGLPDRQLVNAPIQSELGQKYYKAMSAAVNFAFVNRQMIAHWVREVFERVMGGSKGMNLVYDVCHNVAKVETHTVDGKEKKVCIHRKGATRSFGPGRREIPEVYREVGQPVFIPGSMGTSSYVLVGTREAEELSFSSTAHGSGRVMSRNQARKKYCGEKIKQELEERGIELKSGGMKGLAEEASGVYKNVEEVVNVSHELGIGRMVAQLKPVSVMKG